MVLQRRLKAVAELCECMVKVNHLLTLLLMSMSVESALQSTLYPNECSVHSNLYQNHFNDIAERPATQDQVLLQTRYGTVKTDSESNSFNGIAECPEQDQVLLQMRYGMMKTDGESNTSEGIKLHGLEHSARKKYGDNDNLLMESIPNFKAGYHTQSEVLLVNQPHYTVAYPSTPIVWRGRPEWPKTLRCRMEGHREVCEECSGQDECWAMIPYKRRLKMGIKAPADSKWTRFKIIGHTQCHSDELKVDILPGEIYPSSSNLKAKVDGKELSLWRHSWLRIRKNVEMRGTHEVSIEYVKSEHHSGEAFIDWFSIISDEAFAQCQDSKTCLNVLGSLQSTEAAELRQSNSLQLKCLDDPTPEGACKEWRSCLQKSKLEVTTRRVLVSIGLSETSVSLEALQNDVLVSADSSWCLDPRTEDVQSWTCDCLEEMQLMCLKLSKLHGYSEEDCFRAHYCKDPRVCNAWKVSVQCESDHMVALITPLLQMAEAMKAHPTTTTTTTTSWTTTTTVTETPEITFQCSDTDNGATDKILDTCKTYHDSPSFCGYFDDSDFTAEIMCCACGGGKEQARESLRSRAGLLEFQNNDLHVSRSTRFDHVTSTKACR